MQIDDYLKMAAFAVMAAGNFVTVFRYLFRASMRKKISNQFVEEMALQHLPYIYNSLIKIGESVGAELDEHPPIGFVKVNGNGKQ